MPKFQVYKDAADKFRFRIRADNNRIVAIGEAYEKRLGCLNGIKSIQKNCNAQVEDITVEGPRLPNPKFQVYKDTAGEFRFHLFARNGEIIAESEGYETKDSCLNGIEVVKQSCTAEIEDLTISQETTETKSDFVLPAESPEVIASKVEGNVPVVEDKTAMPSSIRETEVTEPITTPEITTSVVLSATEPEVMPSTKRNEILEELRKIRSEVEKPPASEPPKDLWNEFKVFLSKYQILGLAVAFVLGLYLGILIQALVKDFLMPLLGLAIPGMADLASYSFQVFNQVFGVGDFLVALITFIIVAFIVFLVVKIAKRWKID